MRRTDQPEWLRERNNDPYGTPNKHPFWTEQAHERIGSWKLFERDGAWRAYDTRWNSWWQFATRDEAVAHASGGNPDPWT